MQKQLKVVGKGKVNIVPDQTIIELTITKKENTYEKAIETSSVQSEMVKKVLMKLGINKESIKTKRFEINPVYKYKTIDGYSKSYIDGFEFNNKLSFIFGIDNKLLGKILYQISKLDIESKINITYSYLKQEEVKEQYNFSPIFKLYVFYWNYVFIQLKYSETDININFSEKE